ncbi:hypothetical protein [Patulibacter sp. SYSU D01012]|uniref:hypothetical protein n=1 Tax=Patulibacter sp. SYSU D01012 TaxID=2817381 RepID=UPI001B311FF3|nr:hypothetical protein [Patulibacter sp. SYSU D01012]
MPDRAPRSARPRRRRAAPARRQPPWLPIAAGLAVLLLVIVAVGLLTGGDDDPTERAVPADPGSTTALDRQALAALRPDPRKHAADLTRRAEAGFANPLYRLVPGGATLTAARVSTYRKLIEDVAKKTDEDPDVLEGIVYLESAGRPDAMATGDVKDAVGFTQIVAGTGTDLLGMKIDLAESARLTKRLVREAKRPKPNAARMRRLKAARVRADPRFDPRSALEATAKYLDFARGKLDDRDDLAVASYHMGVGNLQNLLKAYGHGTIPYVELYFGIDPLSSPKAATMAASLADDSTSYLWRVGAAERIMALFRKDPDGLKRQAELQTRKASPEDVLHPVETTKTYDEPSDLQAAEASGELVPLPRKALRANGLSISPSMGELAPKLDQRKTLYRALRPGALAGLLTIGGAMQALNGDRKPATRLIVTSTVRDKEYQSLLGAENVQATKALSQHTTGWAMDIGRTYRSGAQAQLFQWILTRMQALDLIAWVREPTAIHLTFSAAAEKELGGVLRRAGVGR